MDGIGTSAEMFECLFDTEGKVENNGVSNYRTKTETAGDFKYISIFPIWDTITRAMARDRKKKQSKEVMDRHHRKTMQYDVEKLMNANFGEDDILVTFTYNDDQQPETDEEAIRNIKALVKRIERLRKKRGMEPLKYIRTTEMGKRYHHHVIVNKGIDREEIERMWRYGIANSRRVQYYREGLAGWAQYITKVKETQRKCGHSYACSRNLVKPKKTVADKKVNKRQVERMAEDIKEYGKEFLEKKYKGFELVGDIVVKTSEFAPGAWIYARLRKRADGKCRAAEPHAMGKVPGGFHAGAATSHSHSE